jgi:DNA polymerase IV
VPTDQRIFGDLHFYFFPNNEKHPARHMRIMKAIEFGATWHRAWNEHITHVILDKTMGYASLVKFLKVDRLPSHVVLVNEIWPSECIAYRALLDVEQHKFKASGAPSKTPVTSALQIPASSAESDVSLKLKPAGKAVMTCRPQTPVTDQPGPAHAGVDSESVPLGREHEHGPVQRVASTDALESAIEKARELHMMPLEDDEDDSRPSSSDGSGYKIVENEQTRKARMFEGKFQCMQKHTGEASNNPNASTITILQQMADYYGQMGDEWRIRAYRKAIATLRNHDTKVSTKEDALALPNIGDRLATKIEEIAFTSRLRRVDNARAEPSDQVLRTFMGVYGAGFVQASQWRREGYTTLDELAASAKLTDNQRIGIEHFEDFQTRIPRAEVEQHVAFVRRTLQTIDPAFEVIIGGSYRRGGKTSGDIDCIVTRPDTGADHIRSVILERLVPTLFEQGFLTVALAATSKDDGSKWHGASCLHGSKMWRRLDLLLVPSDEIGAALIYFTGNDIFNRSLRLLASTKGMRLNQRGLYKDVIRGKGREKLSEGTLVEGKDERRIFEVLGVPYRPPEHRIV